MCISSWCESFSCTLLPIQRFCALCLPGSACSAWSTIFQMCMKVWLAGSTGTGLLLIAVANTGTHQSQRYADWPPTAVVYVCLKFQNSKRISERNSELNCNLFCAATNWWCPPKELQCSCSRARRGRGWWWWGRLGVGCSCTIVYLVAP